MEAGIKAVCAQLKGSMKNESEQNSDSSKGLIGIGLFMGIIIIGTLIFVLAIRHANKCPKCGQHQLQRTNSR
ncbi:hypothetical protein EVA_08153 [gut metagenome]|uniref:Uncharacterized protein n=1 Tax=gut metagenome TaxID=749906 RepID=J9G918_9ZZZZ